VLPRNALQRRNINFSFATLLMLILRLALALVRLLLLLLSVPALRRLLAALLVRRRRTLLLLVLGVSITVVLHGHDIGTFVEGLVELANVTGDILVAGNGKGNERLESRGVCISAKVFFQNVMELESKRRAFLKRALVWDRD